MSTGEISHHTKNGTASRDGQQHETAVAVADTHTVLRESLAAYLARQEDLRVVGSTSSLSALADLVASTRPEVLIVDADMFGDRGIEAVRQFTSTPRGPAVVLLLARDDREPAAAAMRLGVSACVLKQAPLDELLRAIRSVAIGQMWMSPALLTAMFAEYRADSEKLRAREELSRLTSRELEVLKLMVGGHSRASIAEKLHVSGNTVRTHTQNLEKKLNVHSAVAAVSIALQAGLRPD